MWRRGRCVGGILACLTDILTVEGNGHGAAQGVLRRQRRTTVGAHGRAPLPRLMSLVSWRNSWP